MAETLDERAARLTQLGMDIAVRIRDEDPAEVRRLREAVEGVATAYERIDGGTETVKIYAADVAAKIRAAIAGEAASDE